MKKKIKTRPQTQKREKKKQTKKDVGLLKKEKDEEEGKEGL